MTHRDRITAGKRWGVYAIILLGALLSGCAQPLAPPIRSGEPIGVQFMRVEPSFVGAPFRILCDFESDSDRAFIADAPAARVDPEVAHTGGASLRLPAGTDGFTLKLASLLPPGNFPGSWTLIGGYFIAREPVAIQVSYEVKGKVLLRRAVEIEPRKWTAVFLDVSALADPNAELQREIGVIRFALERAEVWCDDLVVLDNATSLVGDSVKAGQGWIVRQRGFNTLIEKPGSFKLRVPTLDGDGDRWRFEEANEIRVRFLSPNGKRTRVIYEDGRDYLDGAVRSLVDVTPEQLAALQEQQRAPALLSVPEELGRLERNAPGDRDNDGYAEATGAYQLKASGPRFEVTISPRTPKLVRPVLEIAGMPVGRVVVYVEGQLIDKVVRLKDGHVLLEIPTIDRPVTVNVRVRTD